jgi:phage terminase small subunit
MPSVVFPTTQPVPRRVARLAPPPSHLEEPEQALFRQLIAEYAIDDSASISLLATAMEAHQRARRARERIAADGEVVKNRFGELRPHPCVVIERDARDAYLRALRALRLEPKPAKATGRPSAW